jgi:hypothetical protein
MNLFIATILGVIFCAWLKWTSFEMEVFVCLFAIYMEARSMRDVIDTWKK